MEICQRDERIIRESLSVYINVSKNTLVRSFDSDSTVRTACD